MATNDLAADAARFGKQKRSRNLKMKLKKYWPLYVLMLPGLAYLLINNYIPMFGLFIAFKDVNYAVGIFKSDWVGFKNFKFLFATKTAYEITRNTLLYNGAFIILNTVIPVALAIFLNEVRRKALLRFFQSAILLPHLMSMVIVSYLVYAFLNMQNGFMNKTLLPLLGMDPVMWYNEPEYWPWILILVNTWKSMGFFTVVFYAALIGIDKAYYEAATLDGASMWKQIRHITVPLLVPTITVMTLFGIGRIFYSDFGLFYQVPLNSGPLTSTTNVIDTYVYRALIQLGDIGMSAAAGVYQSIVGFVLVIASNWIVRRYNRDNALF